MVKSTGVIKKIDELGRVVLPAEARKMLGINEKDSLEVIVDEGNGHIILQKVKL